MSSITATSNTSGTASPLDDLDILVLSEVVSYIGPYHYYFVAMINRRFRERYIEVFPNNRKTSINASTVGYADVCYHSHYQFKYGYYDLRKLCASAAKYGNLPALQYLRSIDCSWGTSTCSNAAKNGHLHILQWAREQDCPWNEETCSSAAENGHLAILKWVRVEVCHQARKKCFRWTTSSRKKVICPWDETTCSSEIGRAHV